jgi:DHA2 family multidrug resistance protein
MSGTAAGFMPRSPAGPYNPWLITLMISIAPFMEVLDTTIANVALPHMAGTLGASQEESTWILTSYLVSNTVVLPISGWLQQVLGRKRFYLICVGLFTLSSAACGFAPTLPLMIVARVMQGLGGGGLAPVTQTMLADSFPPEKRSQAFALLGFTVVAAPAIGPLLGGWLTDHFSWHWIFLINLPVGLLALALVATFVTEPEILIRERAERLRKGLQFDWLGLVLVFVGFGFLQIFLDKFQEDDGFSSPFILTTFVVWTVSLALLAVWEWQHPFPVMNLRLFRSRNFVIGNILLFALGFALLSTTQLVPQLTQTVLGYDATTSGLSLAVGGMATISILPFAGFITGKVAAPKYLIMGAFFEIGCALILQSTIPPDPSFGVISFYRILQVVALPFLFIPINAVAYFGVPPGKNDEASALINQSRNLGSSVGISFVNTLLAWREQFHHERLAEAVTPYNIQLHGMTAKTIAPLLQTQSTFMSYLDVFWLIGIVALLISPIALLIRTPPKRKPA